MTDVTRLRPLPALFRRGLFSVVAFFVPVMGALYYLTVNDGPWQAVVIIQVVATVVVGFVATRYFTAAIWVDSTGVAERGFFRNKKRFSASDIGSIVLVNATYVSQPAGVPQLFVRGHDGKQLVRMRGWLWSRADMDIVAETLDVPFIPVAEKMSSKEIHEKFPGTGYWFERRPVLAAVAFGATIAAVGYVGIVIFKLVSSGN